jgi:hypothetical protein
MPRRVPRSAFEWLRSSSNVSCRLANVVRSQLLRAAPATGGRRGDRFPPRSAGGDRQVEHASNEYKWRRSSLCACGRKAEAGRSECALYFGDVL